MNHECEIIILKYSKYSKNNLKSRINKYLVSRINDLN